MDSVSILAVILLLCIFPMLFSWIILKSRNAHQFDEYASEIANLANVYLLNRENLLFTVTVNQDGTGGRWKHSAGGSIGISFDFITNDDRKTGRLIINAHLGFPRRSLHLESGLDQISPNAHIEINNKLYPVDPWGKYEIFTSLYEQIRAFEERIDSVT